jgi:hypothetical protein
MEDLAWVKGDLGRCEAPPDFCHGVAMRDWFGAVVFAKPVNCWKVWM